MKKNIVYIITIVFLITGGWIIKNVVSENSDVAQDFPLESLNDVEKIENSKTYTSTTFGFDIQYPENWVVSSNEKEIGYNVSFSSISLTEPRIPSNETKIEIMILDNNEEDDIGVWVEKFHTADQFANTPVGAVKSIIIANKDSILEIINTAGNNYVVGYIPVTNNKVMMVTGPSVNHRYYKTYFQMLKTLRLNFERS